MSIAPELTEVKAEVADVLRDVFENEGARLLLLKRGGETSKYALVQEITSGWRARFNEYRGQMGIRMATTADGFNDVIGQTSHFAYGVPQETEPGVFKIEVFAIDPEQRDITPPADRSYLWKIYGTKLRNERFTIPVP